MKPFRKTAQSEACGYVRIPNHIGLSAEALVSFSKACRGETFRFGYGPLAAPLVLARPALSVENDGYPVFARLQDSGVDHRNPRPFTERDGQTQRLADFGAEVGRGFQKRASQAQVAQIRDVAAPIIFYMNGEGAGGSSVESSFTDWIVVRHEVFPFCRKRCPGDRRACCVWGLPTFSLKRFLAVGKRKVAAMHISP